MEENTNKLHFKSTNFNSSTHVTVRWAYLCVLIKILSSSLKTMLIVDMHCSDVCCDEFPVPRIDRKSKQVKEQWREKFYLHSIWGKTRYFKHRKYQHLRMNNNVRGDKNVICLHFLPYMLNICRKFEFLISQGSVATCLRWGGQCCICYVANFMRFPAVQKFWKSVKIWQSYRELKGGNFFETQCNNVLFWCQVIWSQGQLVIGDQVTPWPNLNSNFCELPS